MLELTVRPGLRFGGGVQGSVPSAAVHRSLSVNNIRLRILLAATCPGVVSSCEPLQTCRDLIKHVRSELVGIVLQPSMGRDIVLCARSKGSLVDACTVWLFSATKPAAQKPQVRGVHDSERVIWAMPLMVLRVNRIGNPGCELCGC